MNNRLELIFNEGKRTEVIDILDKTPKVGRRYFSKFHNGELEITEVNTDKTIRFKWLSGVHFNASYINDSAGKDFCDSPTVTRIK